MNAVQYKVFVTGPENEHEIRRLKVDNNARNDYFYLKRKIAACFPVLKDLNFNVNWQDEEGDYIRISSDEELIIAINENSSQSYKKIYVNIIQQQDCVEKEAETCTSTDEVCTDNYQEQNETSTDSSDSDSEKYSNTTEEDEDQLQHEKEKVVYQLTLLVEQRWYDEFYSLTSHEFLTFSEGLEYDLEELCESLPGEQTAAVKRIEKSPDIFFVKVTVNLESTDFSNASEIEKHVHEEIRKHHMIGTHIIGNSGNFTFNTFEELDPAEIEKPEHPTVTCNSCKQHPLYGFRYKCLVCYDYDLCVNCEKSQSVHTEHPMLRIPVPISLINPLGRTFANEKNAIVQNLRCLLNE